MKATLAVFKNQRFIFTAFAIAAIVTAYQQTILHESNNYRIFFNSLIHLLQKTNLYAKYPAENLDYFLYSPSFPVVFSPFFILPFKLGCFIWHLAFAAAWVFAVYKMPVSNNKKVFMYWYGFQELLTALGNSQTNPLIAAIPLFAFICFEKNKPVWAAFFIIFGFEIKVYSLVTAALFLVYPQKLKFIFACVGWFILFTALPLLVTTPAHLVAQYQWWFERLLAKSDFEKFGNVSLHRLVHQFISMEIPTLAIIGAGISVFCSVFIHIKSFAKENFRMLLLASVLIFQVIFNPAAESAAYITAISGVVIYWLYSPKATIDWILIIACYVLTVMAPTEFMPAAVKKHFILPYAVKAWACILIWLRVIYLLHVEGRRSSADTVVEVA